MDWKIIHNKFCILSMLSLSVNFSKADIVIDPIWPPRGGGQFPPPHSYFCDNSKSIWARKLPKCLILPMADSIYILTYFLSLDFNVSLLFGKPITKASRLHHLCKEILHKFLHRRFQREFANFQIFLTKFIQVLKILQIVLHNLIRWVQGFSKLFNFFNLSNFLCIFLLN